MDIRTQTADSSCNTFAQDTESHSCPDGELQFFMNLQIFKLEGIVYALHTTLDFPSAIPTVKDLHNERSELCHISRFREDIKF